MNINIINHKNIIIVDPSFRRATYRKNQPTGKGTTKTISLRAARRWAVGDTAHRSQSRDWSWHTRVSVPCTADTWHLWNRPQDQLNRRRRGLLPRMPTVPLYLSLCTPTHPPTSVPLRHHPSCTAPKKRVSCWLLSFRDQRSREQWRGRRWTRTSAHPRRWRGACSSGGPSTSPVSRHASRWLIWSHRHLNVSFPSFPPSLIMVMAVLPLLSTLCSWINTYCS
jgi:hypothetical protein